MRTVRLIPVLIALILPLIWAPLAAGTAKQSSTKPKAPAKSTTTSKTAAKSATASSSKSASAKKSSKGKATASTSKGKKKGKSTTARNRGQQKPEPERIREIQSALAGRGYNVEPSGVWDARSVEALKKFQADNEINNLTGKGKLDSLTLIALGLGPKHDPPAEKPKPNPEGQQP